MVAKKGSSIEDSYRYCKDMIKRNSKSFFYAFRQLPKEKADAVFAIYTFCRNADDSVDENNTKVSQKVALDQLEEELQLFEQGKEIDHPMWIALRDVFNRYNMDIAPFYDQLKGQRMDIEFKQPKTLKELESYSYYVAGTVGLMLLPIIAEDSTINLREQSISLGVAMQITNILRDVGEDYKRKDRIYLPESLVNSEIYSKDDLKNAQINNQFIEIWEFLAHRAEELYDHFYESIFYYDEDSRFQVLLAAKIYRGILNTIRKNGYDCFHTRNFVSPLEMKKIHRATCCAMKGKVSS